jgi:hypothetical protein
MHIKEEAREDLYMHASRAAGSVLLSAAGSELSFSESHFAI